MDKNLPFKKWIYVREENYNTELANSPEALHHDLENNTAKLYTTDGILVIIIIFWSDSSHEMEDERAPGMMYKRKPNRLKNLQAEDDFIQIENTFRGIQKTFYY